MALALPLGLTPSEVAFLCEMEYITVIPRQKLEQIDLFGGPTPALQPPIRQNLPLWLALLLKRQRRANIVPPKWLQVESLSAVLEIETEIAPETFSPPPKLPSSADGRDVISPPFLSTSTVEAQFSALPYHWMDMGEMLLEAAPDDIQDAEHIRRLLRDLREARLAKLRSGLQVLDAGGGIQLNGVGGMELAEGRAFICGVIDGLRRIGASREAARKESETGGENTYRSGVDNDDDDEMLL